MKTIILISIFAINANAQFQMPKEIKDSKALGTIKATAQQITESCKKENVELCKEKNIDKLKSCLQKNYDKLSDACKASLKLAK